MYTTHKENKSALEKEIIILEDLKGSNKMLPFMLEFCGPAHTGCRDTYGLYTGSYETIFAISSTISLMNLCALCCIVYFSEVSPCNTVSIHSANGKENNTKCGLE